MEGHVRKIIKFSAVDGPGNRSVIFLQGCNLNCLYCHNPETISLKADDMKLMTVEQVFEQIGAAKKYIRGITISGGECMLQRDFVLELLKAAKEQGFTTAVDTNGTYDFSCDAQLLNYTDGIMLDIKSADEKEHKKITGAPNKMILSNLKYLADASKLLEVRTVLSESILDCNYTVDFVSKFLGKYGRIRYKLIKYRPMGVRKEFIKDIKVPSKNFMESLKALALNNGVKDVIVI